MDSRPGNESGFKDDEKLQADNKDQPKFLVEYLGKEQKDFMKFLETWIQSSEISINFKLTKQLNEPIGAKIRRTMGISGQGERESLGLDEGLDLRLAIESQKYTLTRLYICFCDKPIVYVVDNLNAMVYIRDHLARALQMRYLTDPLAVESSRSRAPVKLYTQNIVTAYKVLHAAFNLDTVILNRYIQWHSFDVAWWMVNDCPTRGLNNRNSSLSLVAKTQWVKRYHHFLHPDARKTRLNASNTSLDYLRLKDVVKAGKTAILKPLIDELFVEINAKNQSRCYLDAEIPSRVAMSQMIVHGIGLDMKHMRDELHLYEDLMERLSEIAQKYYAKSCISLKSISQVARVLYQDLDLKKYLLEHSTISNITKDPTNSEVLTILGQYHPFPKLVQGYRKIGKALEALQSVSTHARYNSDLDMMRVFGHCDFWQLTGRVSMYDPDLFLINRNFSIVIPAHGNRQEEVIDCAPRRCFIPSKGWTLLAADYSQLELRLLAHFSEDPNLLEILNRDLDSGDNFDVFKNIASKIHHIPIGEVSGEQRQQAKQICYGMIYGMGNTTLSNRLNVDQQRADSFRQDFYTAFPRILAYIEELMVRCRQDGYVESLLHRRRPLDGINATDKPGLKAKAERVAINTRIQSSASDIIKLAIRAVNQKIVENFSAKVRLVLEMHDELIYELDPVVLDEFANVLKCNMEQLTITEGLKVKLLVNLKRGTDWSNLQDFKP